MLLRETIENTTFQSEIEVTYGRYINYAQYCIQTLELEVNVLHISHQVWLAIGL